MKTFYQPTIVLHSVQNYGCSAHPTLQHTTNLANIIIFQHFAVLRTPISEVADWAGQVTTHVLRWGLRREDPTLVACCAGVR